MRQRWHYDDMPTLAPAIIGLLGKSELARVKLQ
jgi:hypothetical protein